MASEHQISVNYNQARACASELEEEAGRLKKLADSDFSASIEELRLAWKGENAELYTQKCEQLREEMLGTAKTLVSVAESIRTSAKAIYDAEMENIRIMQARRARAAKAAAEAAKSTASVQTSSKNQTNVKKTTVKKETQEKADDVMDVVTSIAKNLLKGFK